MNRHLKFILCLALAICASSTARATTIIPSSLEYMADFCDTIVMGYVMDQYSYKEDKMIFTNVVISVERFEKNDFNETAKTIEVKIPGGQVGDIKLEMDQAPKFSIEDKVLLFLKKYNNEYYTYALNYGVYKITWDDTQQKEFIDGPLFHQEIHYQPQSMIRQTNTSLLGKTEFSVFLKQLRNNID